jgi:hypothetical protein
MHGTTVKIIYRNDNKLHIHVSSSVAAFVMQHTKAHCSEFITLVAPVLHSRETSVTT